MKIMVLGGRGMAGHMIADYLQRYTSFDVIISSRQDKKNHVYLDVDDLREVATAIETIKPDIIVNCIGILNHFATDNPLKAIFINSFLPHFLIQQLEKHNGKLIHLSTDCVFSGGRGNYTENDEPDGTTVYARTKILGESKNSKHLVIRTSIIGPELKDGIGLFHWFFKQTGEVKGYQNVLWNGITTLELAKFVDYAIRHDIRGLFHLASSESISKGDLLALFQHFFSKKDVTITSDFNIFSNKTLNSEREDIAYQVPAYSEMLTDLKNWMSRSDYYKNYSNYWC